MRLTKATKRTIQKWANRNHFDITVVLGNEFEYNSNTNELVIEKLYNTNNDKDFITCLNSLGLNTNVDTIILSILHELGHANTVDNFNDIKWAYDNFIKEHLYLFYKNRTTLNTIYWNRPTEKVANIWAINYANTHEKELKKLSEKIKKTLA